MDSCPCLPTGRFTGMTWFFLYSLITFTLSAVEGLHSSLITHHFSLITHHSPLITYHLSLITLHASKTVLDTPSLRFGTRTDVVVHWFSYQEIPSQLRMMPIGVSLRPSKTFLYCLHFDKFTCLQGRFSVTHFDF